MLLPQQQFIRVLFTASSFRQSACHLTNELFNWELIRESLAKEFKICLLFNK